MFSRYRLVSVPTRLPELEPLASGALRLDQAPLQNPLPRATHQATVPLSESATVSPGLLTSIRPCCRCATVRTHLEWLEPPPTGGPNSQRTLGGDAALLRPSRRARTGLLADFGLPLPGTPPTRTCNPGTGGSTDDWRHGGGYRALDWLDAESCGTPDTT
jgi:hypothetical protein